MIPLENKVMVWLSILLRMLLCCFLFVLIYFHRKKRNGTLPAEKVLRIQKWEKGGLALVLSLPVILLFIRIYALLNNGAAISPLLLFVAMNVAVVVYLVNFIRLLIQK